MVQIPTTSSPLSAFRLAQQITQAGVNAPLQTQILEQQVQSQRLADAFKVAEIAQEGAAQQRMAEIMGGMQGMSLPQQAEAMIRSGNPELMKQGTSLLNATKAPASTNINLKIDQKGAEAYSKLAAEQMAELSQKASDASASIVSNEYAIEKIKEDPTALTGSFANAKGNVSAILQAAGFPEEKLENYGLPKASDFESVKRVMKRAVIDEAKTKALGSGVAVSNKDLGLYNDVAGKITDTADATIFNLRYKNNLDRMTRYADDYNNAVFDETGSVIKANRAFKKLQRGTPIMKQIKINGKKTPVMFSEFYENIKAQRNGDYTLEEAMKDFKELK